MTLLEVNERVKKFGIMIEENELTDKRMALIERGSFDDLLNVVNQIITERHDNKLREETKKLIDQDKDYITEKKKGGVDFKMISAQDFYRIATTHPKFTSVRKILADHGTEFTIYSCTNDLIEKLHDMKATGKTKEMLELIEYIKESNAKEQDIEEIMFKTKQSKKESSIIDDFFSAFENDNTKERLFIIMGETGVGKSYIVEQRYPNIIQYASNKGLDPYSLCYYLADKDGTGLKPYETPFLQSIRKGEHVFMDEGNELPQDTLMFIQGLTDEKKNVVIGDETVEIAKGFKILMSLNPPSETDERMPLGDALLGRAVGIVLELTDEIICKRLNVTENWLYAVRTLYNHIRNSGMIDMRDLNFRDYQRFIKYNFETQLQFKVCMGDVTNIKEFRKIQTTGEYQRLLKRILEEVI